MKCSLCGADLVKTTGPCPGGGEHEHIYWICLCGFTAIEGEAP